MARNSDYHYERRFANHCLVLPIFQVVLVSIVSVILLTISFAIWPAISLPSLFVVSLVISPSYCSPRHFPCFYAEAQSTRANTMVVGGEAVRRKEVIRPERTNLEIRRHFYTVRAGSRWNELPEEVKDQKSVNGFKNSYDKWRRKYLLRKEIESTTGGTLQWREESRELRQT